MHKIDAYNLLTKISLLLKSCKLCRSINYSWNVKLKIRIITTTTTLKNPHLLLSGVLDAWAEGGDKVTASAEEEGVSTVSGRASIAGLGVREGWGEEGGRGLLVPFPRILVVTPERDEATNNHLHKSNNTSWPVSQKNAPMIILTVLTRATVNSCYAISRGCG